jgi:hypothetical protein
MHSLSTDCRNGPRSHRESGILSRRGHSCVSISQHRVVSSVKLHNLDSTSMQFRLNLQGLGILGGVHERIQYADVEAKKANRNDEAESAQTEIHRSFANEGAEPKGPRPCRFSAAAVWHVSPFAAGRTSWPIGAGASRLLRNLPGAFDGVWRNCFNGRAEEVHPLVIGSPNSAFMLTYHSLKSVNRL